MAVLRGSAEPAATDGFPFQLESLEVHATRLDGLNNQGLLQGGANAALYHDVVTREDIARLGVSSMEELFRRIPQSSSTTTSLQAPVEHAATTGGVIAKASTIGLRGFASAQTVVLINGRALPRTGLLGDEGADISRIPIAAIERIELLPHAGSAIYGAGAIGGAVNVILRKGYTGRQVTAAVGTSTAGGATEYRFTWLEGRGFNEGRTSLTATLSTLHREPLRAGQREYLDEALRRYGPASTAADGRGMSVFESLIIPSFAGAPATIVMADPPGAALADLGIPGAPGARYAAIPAGTTPADSVALTPADFTATAGQATLSPRQGRTILYEPVESLNLTAQVEHGLLNDQLKSYGEFSVGRNRKDYRTPQRLVLSLDAEDPLNPFRSDVTPGFTGRAINVFLDTPDLREPSVSQRDEAARAVLGLKGTTVAEWEWSVDGVIDYAHRRLRSSNPPDNLTSLTSLAPFSIPGPAAPAESRRAVYPILADHAAHPIAPAESLKYFDYVRSSSSNSVQAEANARVLGTLAHLPAGPWRTSVAGKYQDWDYTSRQVLTGSAAWSQLVHNGPMPDSGGPTHGTRKIWMGAIEMSVPVIGPAWRPVPVQSFEIQGSVSFERDESGAHPADAASFVDTQSADSYVVAGKLQLVRDVALRASYSEGFYPPEWHAVSEPVTTFQVPGFFPDPARGNTIQFSPLMTISQGGNPDLKPETAASEVIGLIFSPRWLPTLSLTVDGWRIAKRDAVVSQSFVDVIANPASYGFLITREAPSADDAANGWLGRITAVDARAFNAARTETEGVDLRARYVLETAGAGTFDFTGAASFTRRFLLRATPTSPRIDVAGGSGPARWRGNASLTWSRHRWSTTLTARYLGPRSTPTTAPSPSFPGGSGLDGHRLPSLLRWDLQATYEFPSAPGDTRSRRTWLEGTTFTLGVFNILDQAPTFVSDGSGYYDPSDDPRQRFVYLQIKRSF